MTCRSLDYHMWCLSNCCGIRVIKHFGELGIWATPSDPSAGSEFAYGGGVIVSGRVCTVPVVPWLHSGLMWSLTCHYVLNWWVRKNTDAAWHLLSRALLWEEWFFLMGIGLSAEVTCLHLMISHRIGLFSEYPKSQLKQTV